LLRAIPGFEKLFTGAIGEIPGHFDAITMVHALEHFCESPLEHLRGRLSPVGCLFVEVPDAAANPLEYLVADHVVHFTEPTLALLATRSGFAVDELSTRWVSKELSMVARAGEGSAQTDATAAVSQVRSHIDWLNRFLDAADRAAKSGAPFGLFGSTIAATWLCGVLGPRVSFFVEEDRHRVGKTHLDRPILAPEQVPSGAVVFLALVPKIAERVAARLAAARFEISLPPSTSAPDLRTAAADRPHRGRP
jgi:hypothetical protein